MTTWESALQILKESDSFAAIEYLNSGPEPRAVMQAYGKLVGHLYWQEKDAPRALSLGLAAISYANFPGEDEALALHLKSSAKAMAFNLASFAWPGWDEPGIVLDGTTAAIGMEAASYNLRLASELAKGDLPLARAFWMVGAHLLAAGDFPEAAANFTDSSGYAAKAGARNEALLAQGYGALSDLIQGDINARAALDAVKSELTPLPDGPFFVEQLATAERVFRGPV